MWVFVLWKASSAGRVAAQTAARSVTAGCVCAMKRSIAALAQASLPPLPTKGAVVKGSMAVPLPPPSAIKVAPFTPERIAAGAVVVSTAAAGSRRWRQRRHRHRRRDTWEPSAAIRWRRQAASCSELGLASPLACGCSKKTRRRSAITVCSMLPHTLAWPQFHVPGLRVPPMLCLVNPRSGGGMGAKILQKLQQLLSPHFVCDVCDPMVKPAEFLRRFAGVAEQGLRLIVAGGDGTVCSVMSMLQELIDAGEFPCMPPVAVLPLGTGNDLARVLGWGGGWAGEPLARVVADAAKAVPTLLDRWHTELAPLSPLVGANIKVPRVDFSNYLGIGIDASIAGGVDTLRRGVPKALCSRFVNKAFYLLSGFMELFRRSCVSLGDEVALRCDGVVHDLKRAQGIILCNISSYGGGATLWGPIKDEQRNPRGRKRDVTDQSHQDGKLDVVLVGGPVHLGLVKLGLARGRRLCQASVVEVVTRRPLPVQVDGEPWLQPPSRITVKASRKRATVLRRCSHE